MFYLIIWHLHSKASLESIHALSCEFKCLLRSSQAHCGLCSEKESPGCEVGEVPRECACSDMSDSLQPVAHQAPLSMRFPRQEYWSGLPSLLQGIFTTQGSNPRLLCLLQWQVNSLPLSHLARFQEGGVKLRSSIPRRKRIGTSGDRDSGVGLWGSQLLVSWWCTGSRKQFYWQVLKWFESHWRGTRVTPKV